MPKRLNFMGLTKTDLAVWEQFCQENKLTKTDKPRHRSRAVRAYTPTTIEGGLSASDLEDWECFCNSDDLEFNSLPRGMKNHENTDKPRRIRKNIQNQVRTKQKAQNVKTPGPSQIDPKILKCLNSGNLHPERALDLHGMLKDEARKTVKKFVLESYIDGKRLILVIPGKGKDAEGRRGVGPLNQLIAPLLSVPPISQYILHFQTAHGTHGGSGAYYIYLKRNKAL